MRKDVARVRTIPSCSHTVSKYFCPSRHHSSCSCVHKSADLMLTRARLSGLCEDQPSPTVGKYQLVGMRPPWKLGRPCSSAESISLITYQGLLSAVCFIFWRGTVQNSMFGATTLSCNIFLVYYIQKYWNIANRLVFGCWNWIGPQETDCRIWVGMNVTNTQERITV